jgi:hypothetical protein
MVDEEDDGSRVSIHASGLALTSSIYFIERSGDSRHGVAGEAAKNEADSAFVLTDDGSNDNAAVGSAGNGPNVGAAC